MQQLVGWLSFVEHSGHAPARDITDPIGWGLATTANLRDAGINRYERARLVRNGSLRHLRRGWYASPSAPLSICDAIRAGGRLTGSSLLKLLGCWTLSHDTLHIAVSPYTSRLKLRRTRLRRPHRFHWHSSTRHWEATEDIEGAIRDLAEEPFLQALTALDSAIHNRLITKETAVHILSKTKLGRQLARHCAATAESGIETICRAWMQQHGVHFQPQVDLEHVGRVDFLVGERLIIEVDGQRFHSDSVAFEKDRQRDASAIAQGYLPIRFSYQQIVDNWHSCSELLTALIRRRVHRRRTPWRLARGSP